MMRYFVEIAYDGTNYHGWQLQENAHSVQAEINRVLSQLASNKDVETVGCGRTDAGVHASQFYLHFDSDLEISSEKEWLKKVNRMLADDVSALVLYSVDDDAHARFDAVSRSYEYHLSFSKNVFKRNFSYLYPYKLDIELMNNCAVHLLKHDDFAAFCKSGADNKTTLCNVTQAEWKLIDGELVFYISANRFLRNMVRAIVGTLLKVGRGQLSELEFIEVIQSKNRSSAGDSVPPNGLILTQVIYPFISQNKL